MGAIKNIVFEGGGGKGAIYVGAIRALEHKFTKGNALISENSLIEGLGGSSAGSITAFVLSLGLSAKDLEFITEHYQFKDFLQESQEHVGKYRMVGNRKDGSAEILIGMDAGLGKKNAGFFLNQKMGYEHTPYRFSEKAQNLGGHFFKKTLRNAILNAFFDVIITGILKSGLAGLVSKVISIFVKNSFLNSVVDFLRPDSLIEGLKKMKESEEGAVSSFAGGYIYTLKTLLKMLFTQIFLGRASDKMPISVSTVGNVIFENGMFSGFEVREFFFDCILYALKNPNTKFHQRFLTQHEKGFPSDWGNKLKSIKSRIDNGGHERVFTGDNELDKFVKEELPRLTFKQLHSITQVNLIICVTNITQGVPNYFSHIYTPDFPVLEAVGASMTIPPALKPLYNEANVHTGSFWQSTADRIWRKNDNRKFNFVKACVLDAIVNKYQSDTPISLNNGTASFIPLLLKAIDDKDSLNHRFDGKDVNISPFEILEVYNSIYKGMLVDGGVLNNIPYNLFRDDKGAISDTLAIKLDGVFPESFIRPIYSKIKTQFGILSALTDKLETLSRNTNKEKSAYDLVVHQRNRTQKSVEIKIKEYVESQYPRVFKQKESIKRIIESVIAFAKDENQNDFSPWNKRKSIFSLIDAFMYNAEGGNVQRFSDHKNLIPLYSFGVDTFDFDLKAIDDLVKHAQNEAEKQVKNSLNILSSLV